MEKHYFYLPDLKGEEKSLTLKNGEFYHLNKVLRLKSSDIVYLLNGKGCVLEAEIKRINKNYADLTVIAVTNVKQSKTKIILLQSLLKRERFELLLEKVTELGVTEVIPLITKNSLIKNSKDFKIERFKKILIQTLKQSGNAWMPEISYPIDFQDFILKFADLGCAKYILTQSGEVLREPKEEKSFILMVGPEGDFTKVEILKAVAAGFKPLSLGENRLRSETAAIVAVSLFKYQR